jgi:hypothetical protein
VEVLQCLPGLVICGAPIVLGVWLGMMIRKRRLVGSAGVITTDDVTALDEKTLLRLQTVAPNERLLKAVRCQHGANNYGWLIATDQGIWWFATNFVHAGEETEFSYDSSIDIMRPSAISMDRRLVIGNALFAMRTEDAEEFATILRRQRDFLMNAAPASVPAPAPAAPSTADELAKFARMRDDGILTEEEFQEQKRQLLGG